MSLPAYEPPDPERPASAAPTEPELEQERISTVTTAGHDPYAALRVPAYRLFSIGWMVAVIGSQATAAALGWEIFERTGSKLALGWLAGVQVIPLVLLALPAGVLADRFDRRRIIQITAVLNALCAITLAVLSYRPGSVPWMFGVVILGATVQTIGRPSRSALIPNIVPKNLISNAITWNASIFQVSAMLGPAIGGLLISISRATTGSVAFPYLLDAASGLFYAVIVFWIPRRVEEGTEARRHEGTEGERRDAEGGHRLAADATAPSALSTPDSALAHQGPLEQLSAGIRFVWQTRIIFATLTLDLFAVLLGGAVYLLPVFALDILHVNAFEFGWLRAGEAIGATLMAMLIAHLPPMKRAGRAMLLAVGAFGACTIVFGLSRDYWLSLMMLVAIGAFDNISVVVRHTLVQVLTPDAMRGRVSAVNNIFIGASNELGGLESGLTAAAFGVLAMRLGWSAADAKVLGPTWSVVFGGIGTLVTVVLMAILFPQLRKFGRLQPKT